MFHINLIDLNSFSFRFCLPQSLGALFSFNCFQYFLMFYFLFITYSKKKKRKIIWFIYLKCIKKSIWTECVLNSFHSRHFISFVQQFSYTLVFVALIILTYMYIHSHSRFMNWVHTYLFLNINVIKMYVCVCVHL